MEAMKAAFAFTKGEEGASKLQGRGKKEQEKLKY